MGTMRRSMRVWFAAWCLVAMVFGQILYLPTHAVAQVGRPPLPPGIVRLPFNGEYEITQVPGCVNHAWNPKYTGEQKKWNEMNVRAFDFGLFGGTEVVAAGDGTVLDAFDDPNGAHILVIDHKNGVRSYYVHLQEYRVNIGDPVYAGDVVALSGESGAPGQPHLHFAVTTGGDPATTGVAANINSLPGIQWNTERLNENGYAICNPNARDYAVGGAVAQQPVAPETETVTETEPSLSVVGYDRNAAVEAAYQYLYDDYMYGNDSAWYVSNVLWAGGLPQSGEWHDYGVANPSDLVNYLTTSHSLGGGSSYTPGTMTQLSWSDNSANGATLGDVIAYDWEGDGVIDHVAVVTSLNEKGYPSVSEHSPTSENRYWTYSNEADSFIEAAYPGSVPYLIRIEPLTVGGF